MIQLLRMCPSKRNSLVIPLLQIVITSTFWTSGTFGINSSLPTSLGKALGINCRGSLLCPSDPFPPDYVGTFIEIAQGTARYCPATYDCGPLNDTDIYLLNDQILCLPTGKSFLGGICAFTQGKEAPATGVTGALIKRKLSEVRNHGCHVCGSVPLGENNDPHSRGILTVNYVGGVVCKGLCPSRHYTASVQVLSTTGDLSLES